MGFLASVLVTTILCTSQACKCLTKSVQMLPSIDIIIPNFQMGKLKFLTYITNKWEMQVFYYAAQLSSCHCQASR